MEVNVKVADLKKTVLALEKDEIEYVSIRIFEQDLFQGEIIPACVNFEGFDGHYGGIDYESIDHVEVDAGYKSKEHCEHCSVQEACDAMNDDDILCLMH